MIRCGVQCGPSTLLDEKSPQQLVSLYMYCVILRHFLLFLRHDIPVWQHFLRSSATFIGFYSLDMTSGVESIAKPQHSNNQFQKLICIYKDRDYSYWCFFIPMDTKYSISSLFHFQVLILHKMFDHSLFKGKENGKTFMCMH